MEAVARKAAEEASDLMDQPPKREFTEEEREKIRLQRRVKRKKEKERKKKEKEDEKRRQMYLPKTSKL